MVLLMSRKVKVVCLEGWVGQLWHDNHNLKNMRRQNFNEI
jgi:hypothetical protein